MKNQPKPNILERAISAISPAWALKRHQARGMMALSGGYSGAGYNDRLMFFNPGQGDANADTLLGLKELRGRSRDLVRNSPIAGGALETEVTNVVGTGLSLQANIDYKALGMTPEAAAEWQEITEREFNVWANSKLCDAMAKQNFFELQDLVYRTTWESGDSGTVLAGKTRPNWPYRLALQIIEADRISNKDNAADSATMTAGIERAADGEHIAAWICDRHPGLRLTGANNKPSWQRVQIRGSSGRLNFIHLAQFKRPNLTRGIPALAPIIEHLKQLQRYSMAEVDAAVNSAAMALFVKMDPEAFTDTFDDDSKKAIVDKAMAWDGGLRSGQAVNLLPGEEIQAPTPGRPNPNFDPFFSAMLKQVGMALNMPYEVLVKHFQASYSAARAALLDAWRVFKVRRTWLAANWCQPIYEEWLADAIIRGRIDAPGFFADVSVRAAWCGASWHGDGPGAIDPEKEANAAGKRMEIGLTSLAEEKIAYDGGSWEATHEQQARIQERREADKLAAPVNPPVQQQKQQGGQQPGRG